MRISLLQYQLYSKILNYSGLFKIVIINTYKHETSRVSSLRADD